MMAKHLVYVFALVATTATAPTSAVITDRCFFGNANLVPGAAFPTAYKNTDWGDTENDIFNKIRTYTQIGPPAPYPAVMYEWTITLPVPFPLRQQTALMCAPVAGQYWIAGDSEACLIEREFPGGLYCPQESFSNCPYPPTPYLIEGPLPKTCP